MDYDKVPNSVLHWNYRGFTEFPLQRLKGEEDEITDIYLKENLISRIPSDIGKLNNLESLYLSGNDITELPREISKLTRLKCLDVSGNRLRYIPDEIGDARNLKFLILDENVLRELPLRIAELRTLRYLSVCDNSLQWLAQRPVYNYHHCEFRFWRNPTLKTIPYSLWYHMFRGQRTRSLNIGCLNIPRCHETFHTERCILRCNQSSTGRDLDVHFPTKYNTIIDKNASIPASLFELCKRKFYGMISDSAKKLTTKSISIYSEIYNKEQYENNNTITSLEDDFDDININTISDKRFQNNTNDFDIRYKNDSIISKSQRKGYCVAKDMIDEYFYYLPRFIRDDLSNGPLSRCENVRCKKAIFDFVYYEFCVEKIILIDATEDIILSAVFCSKSCVDAWKPNKNILNWKFKNNLEKYSLMLSPSLSQLNNDDKIRQEKADSVTSHGYFLGHNCYLPKNKISGFEVKCSRLRGFMLDLTSVRMGDVRARSIYRSYAAICAEKFRQYKHYPYSIHPYSKLRIWLELLFTICMISTNILMAVHYSATNPDNGVHQEYILLIFDYVFLFNIFINFFTGYIEGYSSKTVVFELKKILINYSGSWLILDLVSTASLFRKLLTYDNLTIDLILASMRVLRIPKLYIYIVNLLEIAQVEIYKEMLVEITFFIGSFLTWNMYFQYAVEYINEGTYTPTAPSTCSWISIGKLWNKTSIIRFIYTLDRAVGMLRGNANLNLIEEECCSENFFMASWFIARILVLHCTFKYIIAILGSESARAKYFIMTKQVEIYLHQRKFPTRLRRKILKFYAIRFQSNFFVENRMMSCVSGQLKEDIIMHTGRQLVKDVTFLKQLPRSLLLQIGIKLKVVIFIAGDVIIKINTVGDCLYFILKGTVAIFSESGKEVCHRIRTASVVAVTNCELFRLDREDFESSVACYPIVYEDIKKVAVNRFERTTMLDEHHKTELLMRDRTSLI